MEAKLKITQVVIKNKGKSRRNLTYGLIFSSPAILGFMIFIFGPMVVSLILSMTNYSPTGNILKFVGVDNYVALFSGKDPFFYKSFGVTLYYIILSVPSIIIFSLLLAMLLNSEIKGRALFRTIFYLPSIVPIVASAMVWMWLFNPDMGLINSILKALGLPTSMWLFSENAVIPTIVLMSVWSSGGTMVIFLAGLQEIPRQYYEAMDIDGGNAVLKFFNITLPLLSPTIFFNTIIGIINGFQIFSQAYILTEGGPNNASLFYAYYLWREAFRFSKMGYACAIAWVQFVVILILTIIVFRTSDLWVFYEGEGKA